MVHPQKKKSKPATAFKKINHGFTTNNNKKKHDYYSYTVVTTSWAWFCNTNHRLTMVFVVKQWLHKSPKKHAYYNSTQIKP